MKHDCHCGFKEHFKSLHVKRFGAVGAIVFVLHLLFHVAECLILPSILVGLGGHLAEGPVYAVGEEQNMTGPELEFRGTPFYRFSGAEVEPFIDTSFYQINPSSFEGA